MAGRNSRSPAGLHTTSPSHSRLEEFLSINPHSPSPRTQRLAGAPNQPAGRRNSQAGHLSVSSPHGDSAVGNGFPGSRSTVVRSALSSPRRSTSNGFVPRIVRGTIPGRETPASSSHAPSVASGRPPPSSPSRTRRPSNSATTSLASVQRAVSTASPTNTVVPPPTHVQSFSRPPYLEHSALRYCIQSEPNSEAPPDRYRFESLHAGPAATNLRRSRDIPSPSRDLDSDEESNASTGDRDRSAPPSRLASRKAADTFLHLPTRWSDEDRCTRLSVSVDGRDLAFDGPNSGGEKEAAAARTNFPIPAACGIYYYEIEILNKGQKGHISIGFGTEAVRLSRLPGWEGQSWGYHGDDGNSFASEREGSPYGPKFTTGDVIGCGIDYSSGQAFFTKNGLFLGPVFENLGTGPAADLYPTVGLRTPGESIRANFGHEPFTFDIYTLAGQARNRTWARIQSTPLAWSVQGDTGTYTVSNDERGAAVLTAAATTSHVGQESLEPSRPINELILAYLTHHGYANTARAFKTQCDRRSFLCSTHGVVPSVAEDTMVTETDGDDADHSATTSSAATTPQSAEAAEMESGLGAGTTNMQSDTLRRQTIVHSIVDGDIDTALEETRTHYPRVLEREGGIILFKLRCRKFVELNLEVAAARRKWRDEEAGSKGLVNNGTTAADEELMDIDDDGSFDGAIPNGTSAAGIPPSASKLKARSPLPSSSSSETLSQVTLEHAIIANGQSLQAQYKSDTRPEVQEIYRQVSVLIAYDDPLADDSNVPEAVKELVSQASRDQLAEEVNRAILESQGRPPHPALERLYRQTQTCIRQLGLLGVGAAAFADMPKEFLET